MQAVPEAEIKQTSGLCSECYAEVPATVYEEEGLVRIAKRCPDHGVTAGLVETDVEFYKRLANLGPASPPAPGSILIIPITYACNLDCEMCFLPQRDREDLSVKVVEQAILNFDGRIGFTGGEPTLRKELPHFIRFARKHGRQTVLITNGLTLSNDSFVSELEEAGLNNILFSFNGFDDNVYEKIDGRRGLLEAKRKALDVLSRHSLKTCVSTTLCRGVNEDQLKSVVDYCLDHSSFVPEFRLRGMGRVGLYPDRKPFHLSEMLDMFARAIGMTRDNLVVGYPAGHHYHSVYGLAINCYFLQE